MLGAAGPQDRAYRKLDAVTTSRACASLPPGPDAELQQRRRRRDGAERGRRHEWLRAWPGARPRAAGFHCPGRCDREALGTWSRRLNPAACSRASAHAGRSRATGCACAPAAIDLSARSIALERRGALDAKAEQVERIDFGDLPLRLVMRHPDPRPTSPRNTRAARGGVRRGGGGSGFDEVDDSALDDRPSWRCVTACRSPKTRR